MDMAESLIQLNSTDGYDSDRYWMVRRRDGGLLRGWIIPPHVFHSAVLLCFLDARDIKALVFKTECEV